MVFTQKALPPAPSFAIEPHPDPDNYVTVRTTYSLDCITTECRDKQGNWRLLSAEEPNSFYSSVSKVPWERIIKINLR